MQWAGIIFCRRPANDKWCCNITSHWLGPTLSTLWILKKKIYTWHTFWSCLIRCANMNWIQDQWVLLKIQSRHDSVHRRTDRQIDKMKPVYPTFNFLQAGGIIIFYIKLILVIDDQGISWGITLRWMPLDLAYDNSTLVQARAWCCQGTSHHLSQCWPISLTPYSVTMPQWIKI